MANGACLPAERIYLELLVLRAGSTVLDESSCMPRLRLDFSGRLVLLAWLFLRYRFRSALEVFFAELELRHSRPN